MFCGGTLVVDVRVICMVAQDCHSKFYSFYKTRFEIKEKINQK